MVTDYFSETAIMDNKISDSESTRTFAIPQSALARFFYTQFSSGINRIQICTGGIKHQPISIDGSTNIVEFPATFIYWYSDIQIISQGSLRALLHGDKFEWLEFATTKAEEYMPSARLKSLFTDSSPKMSNKQAKLKGMKTPARTATINEDEHLPHAPVTSFGITPQVDTFLQTAATLSQMRELFDFASQAPSLSARKALEGYLDGVKNSPSQGISNLENPVPGNPAQNNFLTGNFMPQNPYRDVPTNGMPFAPPGSVRTPGLNPFGASPGPNSLGLSNGIGAMGSPHMRLGGSPGHPGMSAAIGGPSQQSLQGGSMIMPAQMMAQHSQQGVGPKMVSNHASPNNTTKKRRASTIKDSNDDNPHVNGDQKAKATPRLGTAKRSKGNP